MVISHCRWQYQEDITTNQQNAAMYKQTWLCRTSLQQQRPQEANQKTGTGHIWTAFTDRQTRMPHRHLSATTHLIKQQTCLTVSRPTSCKSHHCTASYHKDSIKCNSQMYITKPQTLIQCQSQNTDILIDGHIYIIAKSICHKSFNFYGT